jgi:Tol biopolymer transport system component
MNRRRLSKLLALRLEFAKLVLSDASVTQHESSIGFMKKLYLFPALIITLFVNICAQESHPPVTGERHLANIKQLTFGGENAEAYFSFDGRKLIFQSKRDGNGCDRIYTMNVDGTATTQVSNGEGRTTCSYYFKGGKRIIYASTHSGGRDCPPEPDRSKGYVWPVYGDYELYTAKADGSDIRRLTNVSGYDAEATVSPNGKKIVFTSERDGDLELYTMDTDGKNVKRVTNEIGYDGGAFFSPDSKVIVYRRSSPKTEAEITRYRELLGQDLVVPTIFEVWVMNADGSNKRQVTSLASASFAPFFTPDGKRLIFCTNFFDENRANRRRQPNFDLALINLDGSGIERVTFNETFDGFPMFSPDGKKLVFASNRNAAKPGDTNVFIADWVN